ncbi:protein-serine/threonine phosphatase [Salvia divinorum]|uniref:Protein-serine/threonine phosphatase n=1 Tax=Salvia divinorum TaxID=28513 RepID=A0ABD1HX01_SALDI
MNLKGKGTLFRTRVALYQSFQVMSNEEAVKCIRQIKDAKSAAKRLNEEALARKSTDDISCIVVRFG